ncbi:MAG: hypothetical protein HY652_12105 [Acidobacteria bacterium]|nr:hypothetical protein [Acidobacteriota bacterium]
MYQRNVFLFALFCFGRLFAQSGSLPPEVLAYPETILYNGQILTANDDFAVAQAMAIRGNLVVLGSNYMKVPENQIAELPIDLTIVDGKIVYDREKEEEIRSDYWDRTMRGMMAGQSEDR